MHAVAGGGDFYGDFLFVRVFPVEVAEVAIDFGAVVNDALAVFGWDAFFDPSVFVAFELTVEGVEDGYGIDDVDAVFPCDGFIDFGLVRDGAAVGD